MLRPALKCSSVFKCFPSQFLGVNIRMKIHMTPSLVELVYTAETRVKMQKEITSKIRLLGLLS